MLASMPATTKAKWPVPAMETEEYDCINHCKRLERLIRQYEQRITILERQLQAAQTSEGITRQTLIGIRQDIASILRTAAIQDGWTQVLAVGPGTSWVRKG